MMMKKKYLRSQIAAIVTFVIAVVILMVIVFINIAKVSDVKTITSQVADKSSLLLASRIGSMSRAYKTMLGADWYIFPPKLVNVDGENVWYTETPDWVLLAGILFIAGSITAGLLFPFLIPIAMFGLSSGLFGPFISGVMTKSMQQKFNEQMSSFNGLREAVLYNAAAGLQSDSGKPFMAIAPGVFQDSVTYEVYNLSEVEGMLKEEKVDRFNAWYYKYRWPKVSDESLKTEMNNYINNLRNLIGVVDAGGWDISKWNIYNASFTIGPGSSPGAGFQVTCSGPGDPYGNPGTCPAWVAPPGDKVKIVTINRDKRDLFGTNYDVTGGFLKQGFSDLLNRLEARYGLSFCGGLCWGESCFWNSCESVQSVMVELSMFLGRTKELLDTPISERLRTITQWFPLYYDQTVHNPDRSSKDGSTDHDYYLRLTRAAGSIKDWIVELNDLNTGSNAGGHNGAGININAEIEEPHGLCNTGRGQGEWSQCMTSYGCPNSSCDMHCHSCSDDPCCIYHCHPCCDPGSLKMPCVWYGNYYTCCQNPPVCTAGDLYQTIPGWCPNDQDLAGCNSNCNCTSGNSFNCDGNAKDFQGQLAWNNTTAPTEVEQALAILRALVDTIDEIKQSIVILADKIEELTPKDSAERNEFVYGWKNRVFDANGVEIPEKEFYHLIRVKLEAGTQAAPTGYPMKDLPRIVEKRGWLGFTKIMLLKGWQGSFKITASRYDQDMPVMKDLGTRAWQLRLRQWPKMPDVPAAQLDTMVNAIQSGSTVDYNSFFDVQAINSQAEGFYGVEKNEIYIKRVK